MKCENFLWIVFVVVITYFTEKAFPLKNPGISEFSAYYGNLPYDLMIKQAVRFFNFDESSRSYISCTSPKSEVSCNQIIQARDAIIRWKRSVLLANKNDVHKVYLHQKNGVGNRLLNVPWGVALAMSMNAQLIVDKIPDIFSYSEGLVTQGRTHFSPFVYNLNNLSKFLEFDYEILRRKKGVEVKATFATVERLYMHADSAFYLYKNFGLHALYFISNYMSKINPIVIKYVDELLKPIPRNIELVGIHIRYYLQDGALIGSFDRFMGVVSPFLTNKYGDKPFTICFASDNPSFVEKFKEKYPKVITADCVRKQDTDPYSAMKDLQMLLQCNQYILTYGSTFSYLVSARNGRRGFYYSASFDKLYQFPMSQAPATSRLYHHPRFSHSSSNSELYLIPRHRKAHYLFMKYICF